MSEQTNHAVKLANLSSFLTWQEQGNKAMADYNMEVLPVVEYNQQALRRWHERIAEWEKKPIGYPMPQLAFFIFTDSKGQFRKNGYIASVGDCHYWAKTKKEAIAKCHKEQSQKSTGWFPYPEYGSFYKLEKGVLMVAPMNVGGTIDEQSETEVEFENISAEEVKECQEIISDLLKS